MFSFFASVTRKRVTWVKCVALIRYISADFRNAEECSQEAVSRREGPPWRRPKRNTEKPFIPRSLRTKDRKRNRYEPAWTRLLNVERRSGGTLERPSVHCGFVQTGGVPESEQMLDVPFYSCLFRALARTPLPIAVYSLVRDRNDSSRVRGNVAHYRRRRDEFLPSGRCFSPLFNVTRVVLLYNYSAGPVPRICTEELSRWRSKSTGRRDVRARARWCSAAAWKTREIEWIIDERLSRDDGVTIFHPRLITRRSLRNTV